MTVAFPKACLRFASLGRHILHSSKPEPCRSPESVFYNEQTTCARPLKHMKSTKSKTFRATAVAMVTTAMLVSTGLHAGIIDNKNNDTSTGSFLGDCGAVGNPTACVGALNLNNVDVNLVRVRDVSTFGTFDKATGHFSPMAVGDSFFSAVKDSIGAVMAKISGKVWPVGEPGGIKAVNGDKAVTKGKPPNCLINTAFLDATASTSGLSSYLDTAHPEPVICSSEFQTHKRFKIAMQPATVEGVTSGEGKPIDLVFDVTEGGGLQPYQVFSKINNYTGKRLQGYKIVVGQGVGTSFQSASALGIADRLHISLGKGEGAAGNGTLDGSDLFDGDGLATFSHGLFGAPDQHFTTNGFFDSRTAGFDVTQTCSVLQCVTRPNPANTATSTFAELLDSDTISSTTALPSNYSGPAAAPLTAPLFGEWLPMVWQPKGIFWDFDSDPTTDADLVAWWDGSAWRKNFDSGFAAVSDAEFRTWAADPLYAIDDIEDVLNLGINYIVKVGDDLDKDGDPLTNPTSQITLRIVPVVAVDQTQPAYVGTTPTPLEIAPVEPPVTATSEGGGCSASAGNTPVDPVLPLLAVLGLIGWGVRRARPA